MSAPAFVWALEDVCEAPCQPRASLECMKPWGQPRGSPPASVLTPSRARHTKAVPCSLAIKTHANTHRARPTNLFKNHAWRYKQLRGDSWAWSAKTLQTLVSYKAAAFQKTPAQVWPILNYAIWGGWIVEFKFSFFHFVSPRALSQWARITYQIQTAVKLILFTAVSTRMFV